MKTIFIIVTLSFATALSAQNMIDLHPYEFTEAEQELLDDLGAPDSFDCQIRTCPTKFKASDMNLFALKITDMKRVKIKMRPKHVRRLKKNKNLYAFVENGTMSLYRKGTGLITTLDGIRVLAGNN